MSSVLSVLENEGTEDKYRLHRRFDRLGRLYGDLAIARLSQSRLLVVGLGGVGSFAVEALARSAIGFMTLVDFDTVCVTNSNRQLQAMKGVIGQSKAELLAQRARLINPQADIQVIEDFYREAIASDILTSPWDGASYDYVVDCIDNLTAKAHLLARCKSLGLPVISAMGAAGKEDPSRIRFADLADVQGCPMAKEVRRLLRHKYDFPEKGPMGITAVYSDEKRLWPKELTYDDGKGFRCVCPHKSNYHSCDSRSLIDGTAVYVTGSFGLFCASAVVRHLVADCVDLSPLATATMQGFDNDLKKE